MEGIKINEIDFCNHINKCRICFKSFSNEEHRIEITKTIEKHFSEITQSNLKLSADTSKIICVICNYQLSTISQARKNMILAQKALLSHMKRIKSRKVSQKLQNSDFIEQEIHAENDDEVIEEHLIEDENFSNEIAEEIVIKEKKSETKDEICDVYVSDLDKMTHIDTENLDFRNNFCDICGYRTENKIKLTEHMRIHQKSNKFLCHNCGRSFSCGGSLANHIAIFHTMSTIELPCSMENCEKKFKTKKQLVQHLKTHNEEKQVCPECGQICSNKHNLTKHIKRLHLKIYNFYCDLCDYKGFFKFNIDQHMKKHLDRSEREKFYCDECKFESISKMSLRTHKRMEHLGQKKTYICHCGKTFTQSSSYYTHVRVVHQKIKNHPCTFVDCSKMFSEKSQLKNHIKTQHLKTRDLPCFECGKMFATQKHLSAHLKYHRPPSFICEYSNCGNAFYTASQLASHYKVHSNQRDHACHICDKRYFHRSHLKKHLVTHSSANLR